MNDQNFIDEINSLIIKGSQMEDPVHPITQITDAVFLGQGRMTLYAGILSKLGITHVVSVGRTAHDAVLKGNFKLMEISRAPDVNETNLIDHWSSIVYFIKNSVEKGGKVLVHCEMGCSRAATVVIAYLRSTQQCPNLQSSYDLVKSKRPWIWPNVGFQEQLKKYFSESLECYK